VQCIFDGGKTGGIVGEHNIHCYKGHWLSQFQASGVMCEGCQPGKYNGGHNVNASEAATSVPACGTCTACPAGRYGTEYRATNIEDGCKWCPAGKFQAVENATACTSCRAGQFGVFRGQSSPNCTGSCPSDLTCPECTTALVVPLPGTYLSLENVANSSCPELTQNECSRGQYSPDGKNSSCSQCPTGFYTMASRSAFILHADTTMLPRDV
jgi:hypothetical protein